MYLALLELGDSTTGPIVEKSTISRSIIYQILENLIQKGLVSYIIKEQTKYFQAAQPERIIDYIEEREQKLHAIKEKVEHFLPQLLQKQPEEKSEVRVFEGFKGMIEVHEHTYKRLQPGEEYFYQGIIPDQPKHFHAYWKKDHRRRVNAGIKCKLLFHPNTDKTVLQNRNSYKGCDARYMPLQIDTPVWFCGYKNIAVIGIPGKKPINIEIMRQEVADSFKAYFQALWKKTKPIGT